MNDLEPIAVWDANDPPGIFWRNQPEASAWAIKHLPDRARNIDRVEFYLLDTPFAVLYGVVRDENDRLVIDPDTGRPARFEPVRLILSELPPEHLLRETP